MMEKTRYRQMLEPFLAFKSISTDASFKEDCQRTASWLQVHFKEQGFKTELWESPGRNPIVWARFEADKPETVLIYGHYDVQPAAQPGWKTDPFKLAEGQGKLYGRGTVDNKGQVLIHISSVFDLIDAGELAYNVVFIIEGDEETGASGMQQILKKHSDQLSCDHILVSDGEIPYRPTIEAGLRGAFNMTVNLRTADNDLHSGLYGGAVPNAAQELSQLLAKAYGQDNRVAIPGFYEGADPVAPEQIDDMLKLYSGDDHIKQITGIKQLVLPPAHNFLSATGLQPTLQVTGIEGGYTGEGYANIIPALASARINVRTVASQDGRQVYEAICSWVKQNAPRYAEITTTLDKPAPPIKLKTDTAIARRATKVLEKAYGERPLPSYVGGSIPIVGELREVLNIDPLLVSLGNDDCNMHGANENFAVELIEKGLTFSRLFFSSDR